MLPLVPLLFLQAGAYQQGVQAYVQHRFADAIPFFEKAASTEGSQALAARYMLGNACLQAHQDDKAIAAFAALFEVRPESAAAHLLTAEMMLRLDLADDAAREARRALALDPHIPQAHYVVGEASRSAAELRQEIAQNPNFAGTYYRLGEALERQGSWDDAIATLERAIWLNPNHIGPYLLIGEAYLQQGDVDDAQAAARHALEVNPQDPVAQRLLARSKDAKAGAPPALDPDFAKGRTEYLAGHILAALPLLEKARAKGVHDVELFFMLGNSYLRSRQVPKARAAFAELFGVPAESGAAHLFTAQMLMRLELEDDAQKELDAALERDPKLPQAHFMAGELAIYRAQIDRAAEELSREIALNPGFAMAYYRLGDAYTRREDWVHAVPPLQRAIWLNPTYSGPYILLGKAYSKKGDLPEAERMLRRALQMDPRNASALYLLGRTLIQAGRPEEGKKLLQQWEALKK